MRVLHVITSLKTGGAEKLMVDLLPQLRSRDNDVELLIFDGTKTSFYEQLSVTGIKIHHFHVGGSVYSPLNIIRLCKFTRKFDIIHTHNTACQFFVPLAKTLYLGGAKIVTTEHSTSNRRRGNKLFYLLDRWMYSSYSKVICIAESTKDNLDRYIPNVSAKTEVIHNGVDLVKYQVLRVALWGEKPFIISMVASFSEAKDQDTLIRAMALLPAEFMLQLVGDGVRRSILEKLIKELNLSSRVRMLGLRSDIPHILASSHVVVLSSHWEGLSLSSIEGMSSGAPFVASNVQGLREIVGGNGVLFPEGDAEALAREIKKLSENREYYQSVVQKCKVKANQFDISPMADKYNRLYKQIQK